MLYLYYTESKTHDYGKNIQRGAPPPPQLLRAGPRIARRRRTNRENRTLRDQARTVGLQFAVMDYVFFGEFSFAKIAGIFLILAGIAWKERQSGAERQERIRSALAEAKEGEA